MPLYYIFYFISLYFLIGAIGIALGSKHKELKEKRARWLKFFTYFIITNLLMFSILKGGRLFGFIAAAIVIAAMVEVIKVARPGNHFLLLVPALLICILAGYGFVKFAVLPVGCIAYIYLLTVVFDGFSQVTGQLFGRRKLAISISPNKTVEGFVGGTLCTIITACLIKEWVGFSMLRNICVAAALCFAALVGDLLASAYKRKVGVKDYSNVLPGHGGILDRFDSFIATGACFYLYFLFL